MRFGRRALRERTETLISGPRQTPTERLVRRTGLGVALLTMALIAALMAGVGIVAAAAAIRATDELVDRDLAAAADQIVQDLTPTPPPEPAETLAPGASLEPEDSQEPEATETGSPGEGGEPEGGEGGNGGDDGGGGKRTPAPTQKPTAKPEPTQSPTAKPTSSPKPTPHETETLDPWATIEPEDGGDSDAGGVIAGTIAQRRGPAATRPDAAALQAAATPSPSPAPTLTPTATPLSTMGAAGGSSIQGSSGDGEERPAGLSDTFFLVLDPTGRLVANPQQSVLPELPNMDAFSVALAGGTDWRTVSAGGTRVRLLTRPVFGLDGSVISVVQSGFELTLHDQQVREIVYSISVASLIGLLGAAFVTLLVTQLALRPIRSAFAAERRFVAAASHELRTPVAVIRASAEILEREDLVQPEGHKLLDDVMAESDRLGRLVGDLLALASAEAGAITVAPRAIEMRSFVTDLAARVRPMAAERGVAIEVAQQGDGESIDRQLVVSADPDRMTQLLVIFIDNAIDHSPPGGVVRLVVRPVVERGRQLVSVGVEDQGPGVPREVRARIFEPFTRVAGRRRTGSTGLGLAIARLLATRQEAVLRVDDAVGGGASFSVWLPRQRSAEPTNP